MMDFLWWLAVAAAATYFGYQWGRTDEKLSHASQWRTDPPPRTDQAHARNVDRNAQRLNLALAHARDAGLNPTVAVKPVDPDIAPELRPFVAGVQRDGETVEIG